MKIDHVHFYVEDATASRDWFVHILGFQLVAGVSCNHTRTEVVRSGSVYFILSSPLTLASPVAEFLRLHPPGVADVALRVSDLEKVMEMAVNGGAKPRQPIQKQQLPQGFLKWGKIAAWGAMSHTLIEPTKVDTALESNRTPGKNLQSFDLQEGWMAKFWIDKDLADITKPNIGVTFTGIDHVVLNVAKGDLERAVSWYEDVLGFQPKQVFEIQTEQSGLRSQVMLHPGGEVQLPINEPTSANSQIQEFLDVNQGPGIQHMALHTSNIVRAIAHLRSSGLSFLAVPATYYTQLRYRHPKCRLLPAEWEEIAAQEILVDWQEDAPQSLLLQTFTQPIFRQPTFFFELIERRLQAQGFGEGNFRALFEAIEQEQMKRGSLGASTSKLLGSKI
ncbi:MAG: 4-hydroxyphenylpyruvate dioxygenase [Aphanothece sp. CMT-3BRIN-NPC111]|jgi:4-hydroxyphenylpyruvate dioxygenase|nr:4-hydroxyphenylpyruvate dioxygenase [Aphanothece sp. CMT-3BRIN-NPC111]